MSTNATSVHPDFILESIKQDVVETCSICNHLMTLHCDTLLENGEERYCCTYVNFISDDGKIRKICGCSNSRNH